MYETINLCLTICLFRSGFEFFDEGIKSMVTVKAVKNNCLDRNPLLLLLHLYKEYLESIVPLDRMSIMGLGILCPASKFMNLGKKYPQSGYTHDGHVYKSHAEVMTSLDSIVPSSWLFSSFLNGIQEGVINVDEIDSFKKHMSEPWAEMLRTHKKLTSDDASSIEHGSFLASYIPPTPAKKTKTSGEKKPTNPGAIVYQSVVQGLYSFDAREVKEEHLLTEADGITHDGMGVTFGKLVAAGVVKSVTFHTDRLKTMYIEQTAPVEGVGEILLERVGEVMAKKSKKKNAKKASPARKRNRDGTPKTTPARGRGNGK